MAVEDTDNGPSERKPEDRQQSQQTGGEITALEDSGTVRTVPDWAFDDAVFARAGNDLVIEAADGGVWVVKGYYVNGFRPDLQSFSGQTLTPEMVAGRVAMGGPVEIAQAAGGPVTDVPPSPGLTTGPADGPAQGQPAAPPPGAAGIGSFEQLLLTLATGAAGDNAGLLQVFQKAALEALGPNASAADVAQYQQTFLTALQGAIAFGDNPASALQQAMQVFQAPPPAPPAPEPAAGTLLQALASGEGAEQIVQQLAEQAAAGGDVSPEQAALAAQAFIEGLQQNLAEGVLPADALAAADALSGQVAEATAPAEGQADPMLQALATGANAETLPTDPNFQQALGDALGTGQSLQGAMESAAQAQETLQNALQQTVAPVDPTLQALASGENTGALPSDPAFQQAMAQALAAGQSTQQALQSAQSTVDNLNQAVAQSSAPVDPVLQSLASGSNVEQNVGGSEAFQQALAQALAGGGSAAEAQQVAQATQQTLEQAVAQTSAPVDPVGPRPRFMSAPAVAVRSTTTASTASSRICGSGRRRARRTRSPTITLLRSMAAPRVWCSTTISTKAPARRSPTPPARRPAPTRPSRSPTAPPGSTTRPTSTAYR